MSKGLLDVLLDRVFDAEWQGRRGEKLTERELKLVQLFGRSGKTLRNVYVPKDNGETSEIDVLFITQKGIFVIESKNYSGWIFGDEDSTYWTVMLPNRQKNRFYNPVKQNKTHVKWLRNYIGGGVPLFSLVVFSERCELKKISAPSPDVYIIKRDRTYAAVRNIWEDSPDVLSEVQVSDIYEKLKLLTNVDSAVKQAHIDDINKKYKSGTKPVEAPINPPKIEKVSDIEVEATSAKALECPNCGSPLVLRTARKGPNAGKQFYGCSKYPSCRYTRNL